MGRLFTGLVALLWSAVLTAIPAKADTDAQEQQFLAALKAEGWTFYDPSLVISQGHMVCGEGLDHNVSWQEMRTSLMGYGYSRLDASTLISKAVSVFCPEHGEVIKEIKNDLGGAAGGSRDDQFVQQLKRNGISIDKDAAVDMAMTACQSPLAGFGWSNALREMQSRYPQFDIGTVGLVMSQGLLGYCPERLG
jgi:hypothetical protein